MADLSNKDIALPHVKQYAAPLLERMGVELCTVWIDSQVHVCFEYKFNGFYFTTRIDAKLANADGSFTPLEAKMPEVLRKIRVEIARKVELAANGAPLVIQTDT